MVKPLVCLVCPDTDAARSSILNEADVGEYVSQKNKNHTNTIKGMDDHKSVPTHTPGTELSGEKR